ncbi:condensation domain-containing protein, partial [Streptomyces katsurahamanus]
LTRPGTFARFAPDTVIPLAAALPWDAFSLELWSALLSGGTSVVVDEPYLSAQALRDAVAAHAVDTVWLTSSLFNMIVDEDPDAFRGLRQVMTGGERLSVPHVRGFLRRHPDIALINGYGPVESTVFATAHRVTEADCDRPGGIPIGRPVPGTAVHLIDGEICVAGEGLALRYLNDPAQTAERFPEREIDGVTVRVYRTGDLGHADDDGLLHYRGRADRQVKIRGHRVEPAEVEAQIERLLPAVRRCRVVARRAPAGAVDGLLAFCVPVAPGDPLADAATLLRTELVHYQRPDAVVAVPAFPVTANGKLDENALLALAPRAQAPTPAPIGSPAAGSPAAGSTPAGSAPAATPADETAHLALVRRVFAAVLGRDGVPPDRSFVDLGGASLAAGRVCARLASELGRPVPLSRLYEHPTARTLAAWLSRSQPTPAAESAAPSPAAPSGGVPLTPMQRVYLTRHLLFPDDRSAHCAVLWSIDGDLDLDALDSAIADVHQRHQVLRASYVPAPGPTALGDASPAPVLEVLPAARDAEAAADVLRDILMEPLDITEGDVWRTVLVPLESGRSAVLGCVVHHIAFDGWSESVLAADLATAYNERRRTGRAPDRPAAPTAAETHRSRTARLALADLDRQRAWLADELTGVPELDWPGAPARTEPGPPGRRETLLDSGVTARLDGAAAHAGTTRFTLLLARYGRLLADLTGCRDFAVGTPVAQRHDSALETAVGCHIDMACVRLRGAALADGPGAAAATGRIVERVFAAQDIAFDEMVRLAKAPRTSRPPLFQTLFVLQDNAEPTLALDGLRTEFLRLPYPQLPLEVQTEVWPLADGGLRLVVNYRPDAVSHTVAQELLKGFADALRTFDDAFDTFDTFDASDTFDALRSGSRS